MLDKKRLTFLGAAIVATCLTAQDNTGTMVGTVREPDGRPSARTTLVIAGDAILGQRTLMTNDQGEFRITLLPPGTYTLTVSKQGFIGSRATIRIGGGQTLRQDFNLRSTDVAEETVEIVGISAAVDKTQTITATTFSLDQLAALPVGQTSYGALALSPGTAGSTGYPVVRGGLTGETSVTVNGISIKDPSVRQVRNYEYVMGDMTEDISVIQSPLNAKYGNASGGAISITSRSGKNHFEGVLRVNPTISAWNTLYSGYRNRLGTSVIANSSAVPNDVMGKEYIISVFGPIIPNHLTFSYSANLTPTTYYTDYYNNVLTSNYRYLPNFANYTGSRDSNRYRTISETQTDASTGPQKSIIQQYKLFWMISQNHQLEVMYSLNDFGPYHQGWQTYDTDGGQSSIRELTSINYRGVVGNNGVLEARFGTRKNEINFANGPGDPINVATWTNRDDVTSLLDNRGRSSLVHNGLAGPVLPVPRNSQTAGINYSWFNGSHSVDIGFEQLVEEVGESPQYGINARLFYVGGHRIDGLYPVYNYVGSRAQTGVGAVPGVSGLTYEDIRNGTMYITEMRTTDFDKDDPFIPEHSTNSFYINDLWTINSKWSVMAGLRFDMWKTKGYLTGNFRDTIDSSAISPRFEVKYDLLGDNQHLFSFSYAHFRGTHGSGNLTNLFEGRTGTGMSRYFWNQGSGTPDEPEWVNKEQLLNPANYGFHYMTSDTSLIYDIEEGIKPSAAVEYTLSYRRAFLNGGSFRITGIYRDYIDLWQRMGKPTPVITNPGMQTYGGYAQVLEIDPNAKREHMGIEMEWNYPLYRSATQVLNFSGNWTVNRTKGSDPWREGNNSYFTATQRYSLLSSLGYSEDEYNPLGELRFGNHNIVKAWITWQIGNRAGIRNTFSLLANYLQGGPFDIRATRAMNTASSNAAFWDYWQPTHLGDISTTGIATSFSSYINGRGKFSDMDMFDADFRWAFTIPIKGRLQAFAEFDVYNIFNTVIPWGTYETPDGTVSIRFPQQTGNYAWNETPTVRTDQFDRYGLVNQRSGARTYSLSCGLRF